MATKVHETTPQVDAMRDHWPLIDALLGGTQAMQKAGKSFLPKRNLEDDKDYASRLAQATLFPAYSETSSSLTGRVFFEPLLQDKIDERIKKEVVPNVNRQGQNLDVFAGEVFKKALDRGLTFVLVEAPQKIKPDGTPVLSQADEKEAGIKPYGLHIDPWRILGWKEKDGVLTQVRIKFCDYAEGEYAQSEIEQIRVYDRLPTGVQVRVFEKLAQSTADGEQYMEKSKVMLDAGIKDIPLICYYTNRTGFFQAKPPLLELAHLNKKHWWLQSSNDTLLDTAQVPILCGSGFGDDDQIVIGSKHMVEVPKGAKLEFVEHGGKSIEAGQKGLDRLENQMKEAGAKLLVQTAGVKTATQSKEESMRENSQLGRMCRDFNDFLTQFLELLALFFGTDKGGEAKCQPNLDPDFPIAEALQHIRELNAAGILSNETVFEVTKEHGWLPEDLTWEDEQERLKNQPEPAPLPLPTDPTVEMDPATGLPQVPPPAPAQE